MAVHRISLNTEKTADTIGKTKLLGQDRNGDQVDAFRHAFWMATLAQEIRKRPIKPMARRMKKETTDNTRKTQ